MCSVSDDSVSMRPTTLHRLIIMRVMFMHVTAGQVAGMAPPPNWPRAVLQRHQILQLLLRPLPKLIRQSLIGTHLCHSRVTIHLARRLPHRFIVLAALQKISLAVVAAHKRLCAPCSGPLYSGVNVNGCISIIITDHSALGPNSLFTSPGCTDTLRMSGYRFAIPFASKISASLLCP